MAMTIRDTSVVIIIQARMGSSRLPGKVLADIEGQPMLHRTVVRARRSQLAGRVVVATTTDASDDPVAAYCRKMGFPCFRGDLYDVLDRYYQAALHFGARVIVRVTADCPVIDPGEIDRTLRAFFAAGVDFAANRLPPPWHRTTPIGLDTEVVTFKALAKAWREAEEKYEREHVMPYLYDHEGRFDILLVDHEPDYGSLRWTVDTPEDLALLRKIYASFDGLDDFTFEALIALFRQHPELEKMNTNVSAKSLKEVDRRG
jgi:spore coat polysaccharide biosynthesis protein SpsF